MALSLRQLLVAMPLTLAELQDIRDEFLADDVEIDFERMSLWTRERATSFFENGGEEQEATAAWPNEKNKKFDIIVVGATGLVGSWCCQLLHEMKGGSQLLLPNEAAPTFAVAGRSASKLKPLAAKYNVAAYVIDEEDPASFDAVCADASVIVACAGPYRRKGPRQLLAAVSRHERLTYVDLSGEYCLVADVAAAHDAACRANKTAIIQMAGPQEICLSEVGARLAAAHLRAKHNKATAAITTLTRAESAMMSGGTVESGVRMQLEEPDQRVNDPLLLLPGAVGGVQAPSAQVRPFSAAVDISDISDAFGGDGIGGVAGEAHRLPAKLLNDVETIEEYDGVWLSPSFLGKGTSRMHRRANALFAANASSKADDADTLPPPYTPSLLGVREFMYHTDKMRADFTRRFAQSTPQQTLMAVQAGKAPKVGEGPSPPQSKSAMYTDYAIAHSSAADAATLGSVGEGEAACYCRIRAKPNLGHGIACGYSGSAYCLLSIALAALRNGGVGPTRCGAALTPSVALEGTTLQQRLECVGYAFEIKEGVPSGQELRKACDVMAKASRGQQVSWD